MENEAMFFQLALKHCSKPETEILAREQDGQIANNYQTTRQEIEGLVTQCNENKLSLNVSKTKELIIDFKKKGGEHAPINITRTEVEKMENIKFLGVTITDDLSWTSHANVTGKK
eukprot:g35384.t1